MTRTEISRILYAHHAVWNGWWPALTALPATDAHRGVGGSFPSVFATTQHLLDAEEYWFHRLDGGPFDGKATHAASMAELETVWCALRARADAWSAAADPEARVTFHAAGGHMAHVAAWECVVHMVTHAHFHRGQLVDQLRLLGAVPPSLHLLGPFFGEF